MLPVLSQPAPALQQGWMSVTHRALGAQLHPAVRGSESLPAGDAALWDAKQRLGCLLLIRSLVASSCLHARTARPMLLTAHKGRGKAPFADTSPQSRSFWSFSMQGSIPAPLVPIVLFVLTASTPCIPAALCSPVLHTPSPCGPMHFVPPLSPHPKIPAKPIRSQSSFPRCAHNRISYFPRWRCVCVCAVTSARTQLQTTPTSSHPHTQIHSALLHQL